jgi:DNA-binding NarL/FixJ family response regulator
VRARARPGRPDRIELLRAAEELAALAMPYEAARCRYYSAEPDQVRAALGTFERVGASADAKRARTTIGPRGPVEGVAAGGVTVHREVLAPLPLTPRETEVASLVAQGLTSAAIAEALFVSLRTVTSHLEHIYTKLGVGSRAALTRLVVEQRASSADR